MVGGLAASAADGSVYATDWAHDMIYKVSPDGNATLVAGMWGRGFVDGSARHARFSYPRGLAVDSAGNVILADSNNHRVRKISPDGLVSTVAGSGHNGFKDGPASIARFSYPHDVAVDSVGNVFVADAGNHRIRKITPDGVVSTLAGGTNYGFLDGPGPSAKFSFPCGMAIDLHGNIFVADSADHRIRKIDSDAIVSTVAGNGTSGSANGPGRASRFIHPCTIAVDSNGDLIVAEKYKQRIRKIAFVSDSEGDDDAPAPDGTVLPRPTRYNKDECAICYEVKAEGDDYDYCSLGCGNSFHRRCIERCMINTAHMRCPMCRDRWIMDKPPLTIPKADPN